MTTTRPAPPSPDLLPTCAPSTASPAARLKDLLGRPGAAAGTACFLGVLSLLAVLCFHAPELLTSREVRAVYSEDVARVLLLVGLVGAFVTGTVAVLRGQHRLPALVGLGAAGLAVALGGASVPVGEVEPTSLSLGLDWFVLALLFSALVFVPLEHLFARRPLAVLRPGWRTDAAYFFLSHVLVQAVLLVVTGVAAVGVAVLDLPTVRAVVSGLPMLVQVLLAVLVADLAQAVLHRCYHRVSTLWRFHSVHHSSRELDWLAGSRVHLVETVLTRSIVLLPLLVLGFDQAAVSAYTVVVGLQAVVAHANVDIPAGWWERVVVLPRYHHWHHARHLDYWDCNYAIHLPLVDALMGCSRLPRDGSWPEEYGVLRLETVPQGVLAQHLMPFRSAQTFEDHVR